MSDESRKLQDIAKDMQDVESAFAASKQRIHSRMNSEANRSGSGENGPGGAGFIQASSLVNNSRGKAAPTPGKIPPKGKGKKGGGKPACINNPSKGRIKSGTGARVTDLTMRHKLALVAVHAVDGRGDLATQGLIAKSLQVSQPTASRTLGELVSACFLSIIAGSHPKAYKLTGAAKDAIPAIQAEVKSIHAIGGHDATVNGGAPRYVRDVRAHNLRVKVPVFRAPRDEDLKAAQWRLDYDMKWPRWQIAQLNGLPMFLTPDNLIVSLPEIRTEDEREVPALAWGYLRGTLQAFMEKFPSSRLGQPIVDSDTVTVNGAAVRDDARATVVAKLIQQHIAFVDDQVAVRLREQGVNLRTERYEVDASTRTPELEFVHAKTGQSDAEVYGKFLDDLLDGSWDGVQKSVRAQVLRGILQDRGLEGVVKTMEAIALGVRVQEQRQVAIEKTQEQVWGLLKLQAELQARKDLANYKRELDEAEGVVPAKTPNTTDFV